MLKLCIQLLFSLKEKSLMKNINLSAREKEIMEMLWRNDTPFTSVEMLERLDPERWNKLSVFRTINSLIDKKYIVVDGFEQYNTQYARKFTYASYTIPQQSAHMPSKIDILSKTILNPITFNDL